MAHAVDGSCFGMGCCQTEIPKGIGYYEVGFDRGFNTSNIWRFSRCSYAVLMEAEGFNFSTTYINTTKFNDTNIGRAPTVIDWAIRDETTSCEVAKRNETGTYACLSSNSECLVSPNGPGYLCNCSKGYEGNPYVPDGCHGATSSCCSNRPSMKEIADELGRLRKLSQHPWAQLDVEMDTQSLLDGTSTASFHIEGATTGYPTQDGDGLTMNPISSYYAR
ncbi:hypothetical protein HU200_032548 [Digitaria exilis]|uniref:Uncharacterized protein n=1 Tax=Digitaria exilis TaxID=1010633 RepID=A0A835EP45_9POAL|nr:hypothetical protein HU200_032548 [Digitaria exilis]